MINWDSDLLQVWVCAAPQWTTKTKTGAEYDAAFRMMTRLLNRVQRCVKRFNNEWEMVLSFALAGL